MQIRLSEKSAVALNLPLKGKAGQPIQAVLTQQEFERLSADLFRQARLPLDTACWQVHFIFSACSHGIPQHASVLQSASKHLALPRWRHSLFSHPAAQCGVLQIGGCLLLQSLRRQAGTNDTPEGPDVSFGLH